MVIPGLQRSQFAPQKKQASTPGRTRELYVLIAFLAEIKNMIIDIISFFFKNYTTVFTVVLTWLIVVINVHHSVVHAGHFVVSDEGKVDTNL